MSNQLTVKVLSPSKPVADVTCVGLMVPAALGYLEVLPNHTAMISALSIGELRIKKVDGSNLRYFVSGGYLEVKDNAVSVLADVIEAESDIDRQRAAEALKRAEDRLIRKDQPIEVARALQAVARSQARLGFLDNKLI